MYGIFSYIYLIFMINVGKYTIHGSYGIQKMQEKQQNNGFSDSTPRFFSPFQGAFLGGPKKESKFMQQNQWWTLVEHLQVMSWKTGEWPLLMWYYVIQSKIIISVHLEHTVHGFRINVYQIESNWLFNIGILIRFIRVYEIIPPLTG